MRQLKGHTGAAERLAGILAAGLVGIEHHQGLRHTAFMGQVVVGDDQVHAHAAGSLGCVEGANAGIHTDNKTDALGGGALNHVIFHAIAFADAVRHVEVGFAATQADGGDKDDNSGGAIHVVV